MSAPINGPLSAFRVEKAQAKDQAEILEFLFSDFLFNEPLNSALDLKREESTVFFTELVQESFSDNLSYVVRDPANGCQVVALRLANIIHRDVHENGVKNGNNENGISSPQDGHAFRAERQENEKVDKISKLLYSLESKFWSLVPADVDTLCYILVISVHSKYHRRGIAGALMEHRLDEAVARGCQGLATEASAFNSQNLFQKLGYSRLYELKHAEWKDADGKQVFVCKDGTDGITIEFKRFSAFTNGK